MSDDMELDVSTNIEVNGTNSIDQAAQKVEKLAGNADEAEKKVSGISSAFGKLASVVKDNSLVKTFEYITKNIIELNKELKETPEVLAKIGTAKDKYYQEQHNERYRNWQMTQMVSHQTGVYKGDSFVTQLPANQISEKQRRDFARQNFQAQGQLLIGYNPNATKEFYQNKMLDYVQNTNWTGLGSATGKLTSSIENIVDFFSYYERKAEEIDKASKKITETLSKMDNSSDDIYEKLYGEVDKSPLSKLSKKEQRERDAFIDKYQGEITERRLSNSIDAFDTGVAEKQFADAKNRATRAAKKEAEWLEMQAAQYEKAYKENSEYLKTLGIVNVTEKELAEFQQENKAYYEGMKERFKANKDGQYFEWEKNQINNPNAPLLLTADAGIAKEKQEQLSAEEKITAAKEEEARVAEESLKSEKKGAKSSEMTAFQKEKIEAKAAEVAAYDKRTDKIAEENEKKQQRWEAQAGTREFRNAHPELFATGGQYFNKRYQIGGAFSKVGNKLSQLGTGGKVFGDLLDTIGMFVKSPIAGTATAVSKLSSGIIDLSKAAVQAFAEIESIKTQLGVVFSSDTQANAMFSEISQYAVRSPFGVQQTSELAVLLKQSGVYASDLMDTLKMLGDTAGGNMEKMKRIANNYAQIVSIGKASMLDMRQFAYAGIPIFEAVSKELGVSQQELRKLISDGKVTSDIIEKVFKDLTGINGIFENATEKGAKTLKARLQNLQDAKQLALSSIGDAFVNGGSNYGGDSLVNRLVTGVENFFSWVQEHQDIKNIERDVNLIASSDSRIQALETLLQHAKDTNNKDLEKLVKAELEYQKNVYDIEKQRLIYSNSYDVKNAAVERYREQFGDMGELQIERELRSARNSRTSAQMKLTEYNDSMLVANVATLTESEKHLVEAQIDMYGDLIEELKGYREALKKSKETTEEERKAARERDLIQEQQGAYDKMNRYSDSASSLMSSFQELEEIYKASDEYKEKQEEDRKKRLAEALSLLKEIAENTGENGYVDITAYSSKQLRELNKKGAFSAAKQLDAVPKNGRYSKEDRDQLVSQYGFIESEISSYIKNLGANFSNQLGMITSEGLGSILGEGDVAFYEDFPKVFKRMKNALESVKKNAPSQQVIDDVNRYLEDLPFYLLGIESGSADALRATPNMIDTSKNAFVAFWKRIMSENTGLTTQNMTSPEGALNDYMSDIANRKLVSGVMSATLKTLGVSQATSLLKLRGDFENKELRNAGFGVYQVDWEKTAKGLKDFATQLSASTEVVSAYRQGLEEEADTLRNIIVSFNNFENADLGKTNKIVSIKSLGKISKNVTDSQLVNALGRELSYNGNAVSIEGEKLFTEIDGIKTEITEDMYEGLQLSDKIYNVIAEHLPKIEMEIAKTKVQERNNKELSDLVTKVLPLELEKMINKGSSSLGSAYLLNNSEYLTEQFDNAFDYVRQKAVLFTENEVIKNMSKNDLILAALSGPSGTSEEDIATYNEAKNIIIEVLEEVEKAANSLYSGSNFSYLQSLDLSSERDTNALERYKKLYGKNAPYQLSPTAWADEGGYSFGTKLIKDLWGVDKGYTLNDLYQQRANELSTMQTKVNGGSFTVDMLSDNEKKAIKLKEALEDTRDIMKSLGEETANFVGQLSQKTFLTPFEKMGEYLINGKDWIEESEKAMKELGAETLKSLGPTMAKAGFELVARGAIDGNWAMILGGLGLAATGGFATGIGNALSESQEDKSDDKAAKIQDLKDQLADLLEQARKDALYYENNMRHKSALGKNKEFSYKSVNDAIITPQGDVVTTDPKDYLIATKTPGRFAGGNVTVQPVINNKVINNTSSKVRQEQTQNADGSIDIVTIIEDAVGSYIASSRSDDAFNARDYRVRGRQAVMN